MIETVWIIDDDDIYKYGFKKFVDMKFGIRQIVGFDHGRDAIDFLISPINSALLPDIIFLDIDMPVMNGWEFLNAFSNIKSQLKKSIKIIMVTSTINYIEIVRAQNCKDITLYMPKPIDWQQFSTAFSAAGGKLNSYLAQGNVVSEHLH
jgi:two-component SAPR family response regulator